MPNSLKLLKFFQELFVACAQCGRFLDWNQGESKGPSLDSSLTVRRLVTIVVHRLPQQRRWQ